MTGICPVCHGLVLEAALADGTRVLLSPRPARNGPVAVTTVGAHRVARYITPGRPLAVGEARHTAHTQSCPGRGGRGAWAAALSASHHAQRVSRGRRRDDTPFRAASGVRIPPPEQP